MTYSLKGRAAIITGGSQGFGMAVAQAYVSAGASVLYARASQSVLDEAGAKLRAVAGAGQIIATQTADVSQALDVKQLVDTALTLFPQIHILVNNAGVYGPKEIN